MLPAETAPRKRGATRRCEEEQYTRFFACQAQNMGDCYFLGTSGRMEIEKLFDFRERRKGMPAGRPKKYKTAAALWKAVEGYFTSISRTETAAEWVDTGEKDAWGHPVKELQEMKTDKGEPITYRRYVLPPTVSGLCQALGIHRSTWWEYCDGDKYPEFQDVVTMAQERICGWNEEQLVTRKDVRGIIFALQNNYGWKQKQEVELGEKTRESMEKVSYQDKRSFLRALAPEEDYGEDQVD